MFEIFKWGMWPTCGSVLKFLDTSLAHFPCHVLALVMSLKSGSHMWQYETINVGDLKDLIVVKKFDLNYVWWNYNLVLWVPRKITCIFIQTSCEKKSATNSLKDKNYDLFKCK